MNYLDRLRISAAAALLRQIFEREWNNEKAWRDAGAPPSILVGGVERALAELARLKRIAERRV